MEITDKLLNLQDKKYKEFQCKLIPNIDNNTIIGIRVPDLRKIAKDYLKEAESKQFLNALPHKYYEENMLHGLLISEIKDYDNVIEELDKFLFFVDNWAVCDIMSPKVFKKNKDKLIIKIKEWISSKHLYTSRFGIKMLMSHYLDKDFKKEYLELVSVVNTNEYYLQMMIAWFFATALAKQWESTIIYLEKNKLDRWVHNKTIQKAIESYRITDVQKEYLKFLKR